MAAGFMFNVVLNDTHNICLFPGYCQNMRFKKSNCRRCLEICPEKAISLNPGPAINSNCTDCGLCRNVCPTEVFQHEFFTDQYLLNQARSLFDKNSHQFQDEKKRIFVHCHTAEKQNSNSLGFQCLGGITANIILGCAISGFDEIAMTKGTCFQCRFRQGEKLLANSIAVSRVLLQSTGLGRFEVSVKLKEKNKVTLFGRREIFSMICDKVKHKAATFIYHREKVVRQKLTGHLEHKKDKRISPARTLLGRLLVHKKLDRSMVVKYNPEFPWANLKIKEKYCSACGICAVMCPSGAISKKIENDIPCLYFNSSLCTNCALCKTACPERAISFDENYTLADILEKKPVMAARIPLTACIICGETISGGGKLCSTCCKRQVWPSYIQV